MFDLKITGGTIVDGTGGEPFVGDVAITDGEIVAVSRRPARRRRHRDHRRHRPHRHPRLRRHPLALRRPGVLRRQSLSPSTGHGVTTVVLGVCGIGFAPARPDAHEMLIQTMESVEDIPGDVLRAGLPWDWETFPEFLDALDRRTLRRRRRRPHRPRAAAHLRDGREGPRERSRHRGRDRRDGPPRRRGDRRRRRRLLHLPGARPHHRHRRPRPRHLRHRGRAVGHRRRHGRDRPPPGVRAGRGRRRRPGRRGRPQGGRLDASPLGRVRPPGVVPPAPGQLRARPVARAARRLRGRRGRRRRAAPAGRQPPVRHAARPAHPPPLPHPPHLPAGAGRDRLVRGARRRACATPRCAPPSSPTRSPSRPASRSRPWASSPPSCPHLAFPVGRGARLRAAGLRLPRRPGRGRRRHPERGLLRPHAGVRR